MQKISIAFYLENRHESYADQGDLEDERIFDLRNDDRKVTESHRKS